MDGVKGHLGIISASLHTEVSIGAIRVQALALKSWKRH